MLDIVKFNLLNKKQKTYAISEVKTSKHFPSPIREWNNSIYAYNKNTLNLIPNTMISAIKLIKSYFLLYNFNIEKKLRTKRLSRKFRRLSSNKIYISNGEFKHKNNKIIINLYLFNRQKHNYILALKNLYLKNMFKKEAYKFNNKLDNFKNAKFSDIHINRNKLSRYKRTIKLNRYKSNNTLYNKYKLINIIFNKYKQTSVKTHMNMLKYIKTNIFKSKIIHLYTIYKSLCIESNINKYNLGNIAVKKYKWRTVKLYNNFEWWIIDLFEKHIFKDIIQLKPTKDKITNYASFNKSILKKINLINKKGLLLLYLINREKYLIIRSLNYNKNRNIYLYISAYIINFYKKFMKRSLRRLQLYFYYRQLMHINKSKYNYSYLQYLNKYLSLLYNKNIEYNLINLKRFYLHSDILSESIALKLTRNKRLILRKLNTIKKKIKIKNDKNFLSKKFLSKKLDLKKNFTISPSLLEKNIIKDLKYKHITGFRLEAKGRLTKRYTASRSVSKIKYKGNLLNLGSSYKGLSSVLLKGNLKSNLQYTKLKSKSRIGSFGIKGWVSGN